MLEERRGRNSQPFSDGLLDGVVSSGSEIYSVATISVSSSSASSSAAPSSSCPSSSGSPSGAKYIEHRVSKMDTLAGVAIKYGVEVADIKRLNGLVTDLQMFAHKSLQIPLPGRHPPSPCQLNDSSVNNRKHTPPRRTRDGVTDLVQSLNSKPPPYKLSPAMSSLHGYYGLTPPKRGPFIEGTEMAVYGTGRRSLGDEVLPKEFPISEPLQSWHRNSRSLANGFSAENDDPADAKLEAIDNNESEKSIRRRQKADETPSLRTPELLLKEESGNGLLGRIGKGLALRPKSGSRTDVDMGGRLNGLPNGDSSMTDVLVSVRKSSSTSCLQDSESSSFLWPTSKWAFKPDAFARPILDGLPKPITSRRNKAALD